MSDSSSILLSQSKSDWPKILGQAIFYSSIQAAIGSVEMSSKFSVINFSTSQPVLDNAHSALNGYMLVGGIWALGTCLVLYSQYGMRGVIAGLICNLMYIMWIWISYHQAFRTAAKKYGLKQPPLF